MSRLKRYDIFNKAPEVLRKISVLRAGRWTFIALTASDYARETESQKFYLINEIFGLCRYNQINPERTFVRGKTGDYIAADQDNNLTLVTAAEYARKFPKDKPTSMGMPVTSSDFLSKNYTKMKEEIQAEDSNNTTTNSPSAGATTNARPTNTGSSY